MGSDGPGPGLTGSQASGSDSRGSGAPGAGPSDSGPSGVPLSGLGSPGAGPPGAGPPGARPLGSRSAGPQSVGSHTPGPSTAALPVVVGASADARTAVHRFVRACVEVLNGNRPPAHLRRLALPAEAGTIVNHAMVGARRVSEMRKPPSGRRFRRPMPVAVLRLRLCEPRPGAVEAAAALVIGDRTWAMAMRLERHEEAWLATTLRLI